MTVARLTWRPGDTTTPETLTVDLPAARIRELQDLIGTPDWVQSETAMWIPCDSGPGQPVVKRLFRLARITAIAFVQPETGDPR